MDFFVQGLSYSPIETTVYIKKFRIEIDISVKKEEEKIARWSAGFQICTFNLFGNQYREYPPVDTEDIVRTV